MDHVRIAELCQLAYEAKTGSIGELEYILLPDSDADYLIFRGTELSPERDSTWGRLRNSWDVVRNLRVWPWPVRVDGTEYRGHAGFIRGAIHVSRAVQPKLRADKPLVVAGHSLGGAVALVTGLLLGKEGKETHIMTVGCPRVFWGQVEVPEHTEVVMYRYGLDIVTFIPLGRHPVKQTKIGEPARSWPNVTDHSVQGYVRGIRCATAKQ